MWSLFLILSIRPEPHCLVTLFTPHPLGQSSAPENDGILRQGEARRQVRRLCAPAQLDYNAPRFAFGVTSCATRVRSADH